MTVCFSLVTRDLWPAAYPSGWPTPFCISPQVITAAAEGDVRPLLHVLQMAKRGAAGSPQLARADAAAGTGGPRDRESSCGRELGV